MKIKQFMTDGVEAISPQETVLNASRIMKKHGIGVLPVIDDASQIIGIITDRDIVIRVFADILPMNTKVEEIMTQPVHTIVETADIGAAISLMADKRVRRLPIIDEQNQLSGMISLSDLALHHLTDNQAQRTLSEVSKPTRNPNPNLDVDDFPL